MEKEIVIDLNSVDIGVWPKLIWQKMFDIYRKNGCTLNYMNDLLVDYDNIKKMVMELKDFNIVWGFSCNGLTNFVFVSDYVAIFKVLDTYVNQHFYLIECFGQSVKFTKLKYREYERS